MVMVPAPGRRKSNLTRAVAGCVVVGCVVASLIAFGALALSGRTDSCAPGGASLSAYEWRLTAWDTPDAAADLITAAEELCLAYVHVDVTGLAVEELQAEVEASLAHLLEAAEQSPVEIGALAGDPWWGSTDGLRDASLVLARLDAVNANAAEPIASVHLDVEPWGLDEWSTSKESLTRSYIDFVAAIIDEAQTLEPALDLSFLVPFWFDGTSDEAPQVEVDGVTAFPFQQLQNTGDASWIVMAYRDRVSGEGGVIDLVADERTISEAVGLAVETAPVDPASITFADDSLASLDTALSELWAADLGLVEIVINDMEHLRTLANAGAATEQTS